ncbi:MAG TPA: hypothetical protein VKY54_10035 [Kiloniellales bacterium]|jgi:hypothetical protein|nr:hypothetical protein [Kiloniellales bacterium]
MVVKRVVILPSSRPRAFDHISMPDGSDALVLRRDVHEKALKSTKEKMGQIMKSLKEGGNDPRGAGKAA